MTSISQLVQEALNKINSPEILVNVISKRVRQLGAGFRPLVQVNPKWTLMEIALKEVAEGKIEYEIIPEAIAASTKVTKPDKPIKKKRAKR
ncbi:MAG: DNA-directed RNA polymerase subunit omega [Methylacidiphilales bacterium]|nr:DNA-directed RNA polymerase subunit omega [Candidatus Methylacidiphilales bacterium]MDW8348671.1 DNA-directed RNA polymerase subunit omega [Verrucomicrobiae bacterium]